MNCSENIPEVVGGVSYDVTVTCPHCEKRLALNQYPYDDEPTEYSLAEDEIGLALFGRNDEPATWDGLDIVLKCYDCKKDFTLTGLEI